jgi:hypothetical protein
MSIRRSALCATVACLALPAVGQAENFGRMFKDLPAFRFSAQEAADLVATELNPTPDAPGVDRGTPDDSATLPAEYTYLGQYADHDLDFDPTPQPSTPTDPTKITNGRTFAFDLDSVFGNGPASSPQLYAADHKHLLIQGTLGDPNPNGFPSVINGNPNGVLDYPRNPDGTAIINDGRNDENKILSQIGTALMTLYNDFVDHGDSYQQARRRTVDYWQEIVLKDLLPAYVGQDTINRYLHGNQVTTPNFPQNSFTPIEFSVGAYRFGHALPRQLYHINDDFCNGVDVDHSVPIFDLNAFQTADLTGGAQLGGPSVCSDLENPADAGMQIQWKYFVPALNADQADPGINFARKTQVTISPALFNLPSFTIAGCPDQASPVCSGSGNILSRDYARGEEYGLPAGQLAARALGCPIIPAFTINPTHDPIFNIGTPLLYYVFAEAQKANRALGCVGGRIVAQTFLRVLASDPNSILNTGFRPDPALIRIHPRKQTFTFGDLLVDTKLAPRTS